VLGCGCGEVACWPLLVRTTLRKDTVIWSDFEQAHLRHWRHHGLGPFPFDRSLYLDALRTRYGRAADALRRPGDPRTR
jgi:hypothetical protein